ncbi:MAG TPA: Smr/MutS family protein [Acetobacteraceae bacterium]|nr:Smr/MutS family protein [Acetobacteraceae bacterium]
MTIRSPASGRRLTEADRAAWTAYADRIAALPGRALPSRPEPKRRSEPPAPLGPPAPPAQMHQPEPFLPAATLPPPPFSPPHSPPVQPPRRALAVGEAPGGVDGATWQRFRGGKFPPVRQLDLHGLTAQRAFHALVAFLRSAHADRLRCVEVITGRGSGNETGVLRRELPLWLNRPDIRPLVLAAAHPHAANPGAVRLLLRRVR